jgi:hypothetical protein
MRVPEPYASQLAQFERVAKANTIACRIAAAGRFLTEQVGVGEECNEIKGSLWWGRLAAYGHCTSPLTLLPSPRFDHILACSSVFLTLRRTQCFQRSSREAAVAAACGVRRAGLGAGRKLGSGKSRSDPPTRL